MLGTLKTSPAYRLTKAFSMVTSVTFSMSGSRQRRLPRTEPRRAKLAAVRDKAEQLGKMGDAISAEVNRGKALGYYVERRESGAVGAFQAKTTGRGRQAARRDDCAHRGHAGHPSVRRQAES